MQWIGLPFVDEELFRSLLAALAEVFEHVQAYVPPPGGCDCWDNAVMESFFGTLKQELLYELPLQMRAGTRDAVAEYIEDFYNVLRRHSSLDYLSPIEFELKHGGALGGSAPEPPFISERGRDPEGLGLTS